MGPGDCVLPNWRNYSKRLVRKGGLEPPRIAPPDPKSGASANFATFAWTATDLLDLPCPVWCHCDIARTVQLYRVGSEFELVGKGKGRGEQTETALAMTLLGEMGGHRRDSSMAGVRSQLQTFFSRLLNFLTLLTKR